MLKLKKAAMLGSFFFGTFLTIHFPELWLIKLNFSIKKSLKIASMLLLASVNLIAGDGIMILVGTDDEYQSKWVGSEKLFNW